MVELFGKETERQNKIKWMSDGLCDECFKKKQDSMPLGAIVTGTVVNHDGDYYVITQGNSYNVKETLKLHGFFFGEYICGSNALSPPKKGWMIKADEAGTESLKELGIELLGGKR